MTYPTLPCRPPSRVRGFTLIELMIALAVAGILLGVALPSYLEQVRRGSRSDAQTVVMEATQFLERFHTENGRYDRNLAGVAVQLPDLLRAAPKQAPTKLYALSLKSVGEQQYVLQAVPQGSQSKDRCGTLEINHLGLKSAAGADCW